MGLSSVGPWVVRVYRPELVGIRCLMLVIPFLLIS